MSRGILPVSTKFVILEEGHTHYSLYSTLQLLHQQKGEARNLIVNAVTYIHKALWHKALRHVSRYHGFSSACEFELSLLIRNAINWLERGVLQKASIRRNSTSILK